MLKRLLIILLSCTTTNLMAYCASTNQKAYEWQRYAGADIKYAGINPRSDWKKLFGTDYPISNLYFGIRFVQQFGVELGYEAAKQSTENHIFNGGQTFFGNAMPNIQTVASAKFYTWHLDFCYFYPISPSYEDIDLFASLGLGQTQASVTVSALPNTPGTVTVPLNTMKMQRATVLRARIGAEYMSTSFLGLRVMIGYDRTSTIRVKGVPAIQFTGFKVLTKPFQDSLSVSIGLIFKF